jgi:hypothetical protein
MLCKSRGLLAVLIALTLTVPVVGAAELELLRSSIRTPICAASVYSTSVAAASLSGMGAALQTGGLPAQTDGRTVCNNVPGKFCLQITLQGAGSGRVASRPAGITCPRDCIANFRLSEHRVTLVATPAAGSRFVRWTGCLPATSPTCVAPLSTATFVTARFEN